MHPDQMNEIINEQEEELSRMKDKLRDAHCERDDALGMVEDMKYALARIKNSTSLETSIGIARAALEENK